MKLCVTRLRELLTEWFDSQFLQFIILRPSKVSYEYTKHAVFAIDLFLSQIVTELRNSLTAFCFREK